MPSLDLPAQYSSVRVARTFVSEQGIAHGIDIDTPALELMVSELVTNVVRHTTSDLTVRVDPGPPFRVEVHDGMAATEAFRALIAERPASIPPTSIGGRGIGLVHAFASKIGLDDDEGGGKIVWFEV